MKKYPSQAFAIVLALLVVISIIGISFYARTLRDTERVIDERSSAEANELAETVIGLIGTLDYSQIRNEDVLDLLGCKEFGLSTEECRKYNLNVSELAEVLQVMGLKEDQVDLSSFAPELNEEFCLTEVAIHSLSEEGVRIEKDEVYSIFVRGISWDDCEMNFRMQDYGASGFVMSTFYGDYDSNNNLKYYKPYEFEDIVGFKYGADGRNWVRYSSNENLTFSSSGEENYPFKKEFGEEEDKKEYFLDEVRFKSLGGASQLSWNIWGNCKVGDYLLVEVGATCGGRYAGKSFILPEASFSPPMFDYVYFQGRGDLILQSSER